MENTNSTNGNSNKSLIAKMLDKLKVAGSGFVTKRVLPVALSASLLFGATACVNAGNTDNSTDSNIVDTNTGNSTTDSSLSNGSTNTNPPVEDDKSDISQYSELLQEILTDSYYKNLMNRGNATPAILDTGLFDPHPYAFLEDQGHDVLKIKNNELECNTVSYIPKDEPNNLYIATYVENPGNYFTEYMLKYTLTDQEVEDYHMLHNNEKGSYYIQAVFMNDVISKNKTATIISKLSVTKEMHKQIGEKIINDSDVKKLMDCDSSDVLFHSYEYRPNTKSYFYMYIRPALKSYNHMYSTETIALVPMSATTNYDFSKEPLSFSSYNLYSDFGIRVKYFPDVVPIKATFFYPQNVNLYIKNDINIRK